MTRSAPLDLTYTVWAKANAAGTKAKSLIWVRGPHPQDADAWDVVDSDGYRWKPDAQPREYEDIVDGRWQVPGRFPPLVRSDDSLPSRRLVHIRGMADLSLPEDIRTGARRARSARAQAYQKVREVTPVEAQRNVFKPAEWRELMGRAFVTIDPTVSDRRTPVAYFVAGTDNSDEELRLQRVFFNGWRAYVLEEMPEHRCTKAQYDNLVEQRDVIVVTA